MANDKVLSIRADDDTIERLNAIAEQSGMKKNELLTALMETYEAERIRSSVPEHAADLDNLRSMMKKIENAFVAAYDFAGNAEERVRGEVAKQLDIYEQTIGDLKAKMKAAGEKAAESAETIEALQGERDRLADELLQSQKLSATQAESIDGLKAAMESLERRVIELESKIAEMPDVEKRAKDAEAEVESLKRQMADAEQEYEKKLWQVRNQNSDALDVLRDKLTKKLDEAHDQYGAMQRQLTDALNEARRKLAEADDAARAKVDEALAKADARHEAEVTRLLTRIDKINEESRNSDIEKNTGK